MKILLTGSTGFVGRQLVKQLVKEKDVSLNLALRSREEAFAPEISLFAPMDLAAHTDWQEALKGCDVVIHAAARVHIMDEKVKNPLQEFRRINTEGTLNLAAQAARSGVKRFIFISTIKVNGELTLANQSFTADDLPNPLDPYAISKYEAEQGLKQIAATTKMEVVIIRPPLVYGAGVKGNFQRLLNWLQKGVPLPLGAITNKRSFVALENLSSLIMNCITNPRAANQVFLVSDGEDLSTTELLRRMGLSINKSVYLLPIPQFLLKYTAILLGKREVFERLCGSLQVNISKTKEFLDWEPEVSIYEALKGLGVGIPGERGARKSNRV